MRIVRLLALLFIPVACAAAGFDPPRMDYHVAVWTGSEMFIWGVEGGARYRPATDSWSAMSSGPGAPSPEDRACAVWTGTEVIVWGGGTTTSVDDGGRYDPSTDSWRATTKVGAPTPRTLAVAAWTGAEMLVWGGYGTSSEEGALYDPATDTWRPMSVNAATPTGSNLGVFTGSELLAWGDLSGGRYDVASDAWSPMATYGGLQRHPGTMIWTGREAILWGGYDASWVYSNLGAAYDPTTDGWRPTAIDAATPSPRAGHGALWDGVEMIVWGGSGSSGGRYDPVTDSWRSTAVTVATPSGYSGSSLAWTGREMIVWGPGAPAGGRYDPRADAWAPVAEGPFAPGARYQHAAAWTGSEMIVWGGREQTFVAVGDGGVYLPSLDWWRPLSVTGAPGACLDQAAVWSGSRLLVWTRCQAGGRYDPASDSWSAMSTVGAPIVSDAAAVWDGFEMIVFGAGSSCCGRYDPVANAWYPAASQAGSSGATAVWTGTSMLVFGSSGGLRYDPGPDTWAALSQGPNAPLPRTDHSAVWTGSEMIVWGGQRNPFVTKTGSLYDPATDSWRAVVVDADTPSARMQHTAVWTGTDMVVWGGTTGLPSQMQDGGRYDPAANSWRPVTLVGAPQARVAHTATWTGSEMVIWGGFTDYHQPLDDGGRYDPVADVWLQGSTSSPLGDDVLAGMSNGGGIAFYAAAARGYRVDGAPIPTLLDAHPGLVGYGVSLAVGDVDPGGAAEIVAAPGPGPTFPPRVLGFARDGVPLAGFDALVYGAPGYGASVAVAAIDGAARLLTGPGPSPVYGPQVRAFRYVGGAIAPVAKVSFYAYGTLRYGVGTGGGDVDDDGFEEILTGAGPGAVFGPHVRGFDFDGVLLAPIPRISYFAYGTLRYGVRVAGGDVDADGYTEILTGPGPSPAFAPQLRGFDVDGGLAPIPAINAVVFQGARLGLHVAAGDLDGDGFSEIVVAPGPDPATASLLSGLEFDGVRLTEIPSLRIDAWGVSYGLELGVGGLGF